MLPLLPKYLRIRTILSNIALCGLLLLCLTTCRSRLQDIGWDTEILTPLAYGTLTFADLVGDSVLTTNPDGSMLLVLRYPLYTLQLSEEYISVPDTAYRTAVSLDSLYLPDRTEDFKITLGQLAMNDPSGTGQIIIGLNGFTAPIPAFSNLTSLNTPIDATDFFQEAEIDSGYMDINIQNGLPIDITDLHFQLKNATNGVVIVNDQISLIPTGGSVSRTYPLHGKTVEGNLMADILNLSTPGSGSNSVKIDTSDALNIGFTVRDLRLRSATAIFPAQNLINITNQTTYNMGGPEFIFMRIRSGKLVISAFNTIADSLYLYYAIPNAKDPNGIPITINTVVAPAPVGGSTKIDEEFDLAGYTINLTGEDGTYVNTFVNDFRVRIDSSGKLVYISLDDSISVFYGLVDIVPEYVKGYMGQHTFDLGNQQTAISFFSKLKGGTLELEDLTARVMVTNPFGIDGEITIPYMRGVLAGGQKVDLTAPFIGSTQTVPRSYENPRQLGILDFELNQQNSNIKPLLQQLPQKLEYAVKVDINPNGNYYNYQDFAWYNDKLEANLDIEMPVSLKADGIVLRDTVDFRLEGSGNARDRIREGTLVLNMESSYPLEGEVQVYFLNASRKVIDSLFTKGNQIPAGVLNPVDCRVHQSVTAQMEAQFSEARMEALNSARYAVLQSRFSTAHIPDCSGPLKIFEDYFIKFNLTGRFIYAVGNK